ncbi:hypothetical protein G6O67_008777 [Ophiocordyceps sinensis]|uniref:Protein phosphatase n=1 Tax=Ophiocordyceps sinensis TaxID=72228 RepID=A0A8H4LRW8_9HYPO|nr:hypothetical protein G6O67_008777 [Ophiocordyceps sinensis]
MAASCARAAASAAASAPWRASTARAGSLRRAGTARPAVTPPLPRRRLGDAPQSRIDAAATPAVDVKPNFSYHVAASFIAKDRFYDPATHVFHFNPYNRIQPPRHRRRSSRPDSGHDAFFVSRVNDSGAVALGIADGVGGWIDSGVNPADFSHGLCDHMAAVAYEHDPAASTTLTACGLMQRGYDALCRQGSVHAGSSTACVAIAAPDGILDVANLGDSGFLHLRLNAVNAYSEPQTHDFNSPYQLAILPRLIARMAAFGGTNFCDSPRDADVTHHRVRHGDVLIVATDGVLDNLFNQDILRITSRVMVSSGAWTMTPSGDLGAADYIDALVSPARPEAGERAVTLQSLLATELVTAAKMASIDTRVKGPFAKQFRRYYPYEERWQGGKVDDICVVATVVCEVSAGPRSKL